MLKKLKRIEVFNTSFIIDYGKYIHTSLSKPGPFIMTSARYILEVILALPVFGPGFGHIFRPAVFDFGRALGKPKTTF